MELLIVLITWSYDDEHGHMGTKIIKKKLKGIWSIV